MEAYLLSAAWVSLCIPGTILRLIAGTLSVGQQRRLSPLMLPTLLPIPYGR